MIIKCGNFLRLKVLILVLSIVFPFLVQAHSISDWLSAENLARLKRGEFLSDEEREAWLKLTRTPDILRKIIEYTHPEYLRSQSLREGILRDVLGPLKEERIASEIDVSGDLLLSLEDLPGMRAFLETKVKTEEEIEELRISLADKVDKANQIFDNITEIATETTKQKSSDCP